VNGENGLSHGTDSAAEKDGRKGYGQKRLEPENEEKEKETTLPHAVRSSSAYAQNSKKVGLTLREKEGHSQRGASGGRGFSLSERER